MFVLFETIQNMYSFCMPKVTDAHRDARRRQIADAAVVCLQRKGVSSTSMADIIAESGLSAGAIYSNFTSKAEIWRFVAGTVISPRAEMLAQLSASPSEAATAMLNLLRENEVPLQVVVQIWAEGTVDTEMHEVVSASIEMLRAAFATAIADWVAERYPADTAAQAARISRVLLILSQGYIVDAALFGAGDPAVYLESARELLE